MISTTEGAFVLLGVLLTANVASYFLARRVLSRLRVLPTDKVAAFGLLIAGNVFVLLVAFVMDPGECAGSRWLACILNENQGVLALGALVAATATIYANSRQRQESQRQELASAKRRAIRQLRAAADELAHNLQHYSYGSSNENALWIASTSQFVETFELLRPPHHEHLNAALLDRIRTLKRLLDGNRAAIGGLRGAGDRWNIIAALDPCGTLRVSQRYIRSQLSDDDEPGSSNGGSQEDGPTSASPISQAIRFDERIVTHSVRFLMEASVHHPAALGRLLRAPSFKWLEGFRDELRQHRSYAYYPTSSEIGSKEAVGLRAGSGRVYCWANDAQVPGVEIVCVGQSFSDLAHIPH